MPAPLFRRLANALGVAEHQIKTTVSLLDDGASVPFIARYRKEATGGLDDTQLRLLAEKLVYLRELDARRETVLASIEAQGRLTVSLEADLDAADSKQRLEDLYLPYKPKRQTKAQLARAAGLTPLAEELWRNPGLSPETLAQEYLCDAYPDSVLALEGARHILIEQWSEDAALLALLRERLKSDGVVASRVIEGQQEAGAKFADWFDFSEAWATIPSHRALALFRGRQEGVLTLSLTLPDMQQEPPPPRHPCESLIAHHVGISDQGRAADHWLLNAVRWSWRTKLALSLELELMTGLRERAEDEAIQVFARNLRDLLLAAPAGARPTLGLDPGLRTGVKAAVIDTTGKLLETTTIYPHEPRRDIEGSLTTLAALCRRHDVALTAIGNGTASRETDRLVAQLQSRHPDLRLSRVTVSEAGASVYSASALAAAEFPSLDVSLRGAVSIARRLQDPLAELVKIDPKAIGVGQYQHDVAQGKLSRTLDAVVEDCVNAVGVDVNTASSALLARVAGLGSGVAEQIVSHRDQHGPFASREALRKVPRLGAKTFEQAAGFLRIRDGSNALDTSAVHPEAYPVVERLLKDIGATASALIGDSARLRRIDPHRYTDERFGLPTVRDILAELEKPGRDPRPDFQCAQFAEGVETIKDLQPGMVLEGCITNVTNFGAFVDIGVHQDGLVHISALADRFVKDPHSVVKTGDVVRAKVLDVDLKRKRIALSLRLNETPEAGKSQVPQARPANARRDRAAKPATEGAMAAALARAVRR